MISLIKIEHQNLNCIWTKPEYLYKFDRDYFISTIAQDIFFVIKYLYESEIEITIEQMVASGNSRNSEITRENLEFLRSQEYTIDNFEFYFKDLKKNYSKIEIEEKILKETLINVSSKGELDLGKLQDLSNSLQEHIEIIQGKEAILKPISVITTKYKGVMIDRKLGKYKFSTGDSYLDKHLAVGFAPGQITTIYASTGMGKSTLGLNLFSKQINKMIPTMMLSLEMDEISTMDRLIALRNKIPSHKLTFNNQDPNEDSDVIFDIVDKGLRDLEQYEKRFFLIDDPSIVLRTDLELLVKEAKKKIKSDYLVCTIDLFTMLSDVGTKPNEIEEAMNIQSSIAKRQGVHFVNIVQANRSADNASITSIEQLDRLRPKTLHSIKNSSAIPERSRIVLSVFRPKHYAQELFPEDPSLEFMDDLMWITILKQNQGKVGTILKYLYEPEYFKLTPFIEESF
jgi:replicative DNA helicase